MDNNTPSVTGYDSQAIFDLRFDTARRIESIYNTPNIPDGINYPKPYKEPEFHTFDQQPKQGNALSDIPTGLSFSDALMSDNPKVQNLALDILSNKAYQDPSTKFGINRTIVSPYKGNEKYFKADYGFDALSDNESWYHDNLYEPLPWYKKWAVNTSTFIDKVATGALTKFGEGVGYVATMLAQLSPIGFIANKISGNNNGFWANVADNSLSKLMKSLDEDEQNIYAPVFKKAGFDEQGFFTKLADPYFWNTTMADGAAFMLSAFIPGGIAAKLGLIGEVAEGADAANALFGATNKLAKFGAKAVQFATGGNTWGEVGMSIYNTASESAFEATGRFTDTRDRLMQERKDGKHPGLTDDEINKMAGGEASASFLWNMAALSASNAWEMKHILKPILAGKKGALALGEGLEGAAKSIGVGEAGVVKLKGFTNEWLNRGSFYGKKAFQGTIAEGFWEENIQNAISRANAGVYTRMGDDTGPEGKEEHARHGFFGILEQYAKQTIDALKGNDRENSESIGVGALMGVAGGTAGSKFGQRVDPNTVTEQNPKGVSSFTFGERKQERSHALLQISKINNARTDFLNYQSAKNPDGTIDVEKLDAKVKSWQDMMVKQNILNDIKDAKALPKEDTKVLENQLLLNYTLALAKIGKVGEAVNRISDLQHRDMTKNKELFISNPIETAATIKKFGDIYNEIQGKNLENKATKELTTEEVAEINETRKDAAFNLMADRIVMEPVYNKYKTDVDETVKVINDELAKTSSVGADIAESLTRNHIAEYINYATKIKFYEEQLKKGSTPLIEDHYKAQIQEAHDAIKKLNDLVGEEVMDKTGKLTINDPVLKGKAFNTILNGYTVLYSDFANVDYIQHRNDAIAQGLLDPEKGMQHYEDMVAYNTKLKAEENKKREEAKAKIEAAEKFRMEKTPEMRTELAKLKYLPEDIDVMTRQEAEVVIKNKTLKPAAKFLTVTGEADHNEMEEPIIRMLAFDTSLKSVNNQLLATRDNGDEVDYNKEDTEFSRLKTEEYNQEMNDFIINFLPTFKREGVYEAFIIKDRPEWQERFYKVVENEDGSVSVLREGEEKARLGSRPEAEEFMKTYKADEIGHVIAFINKTDNTIKSFPKSGRPAVFSFNENGFNPDTDNKYNERVTRRNEALKVADSAEVFAKERENAKNIRALLDSGATDRFKIEITGNTDGIIETTPKAVPVAQRFPGYTWRIITEGKETVGGQEFKNGDVIAEKDGEAFKITSNRIADVPELRSEIELLLSQKYTQEEAKRVVEYLKTFVFVKTNINFFKISPEGKISYYYRDSKTKSVTQGGIREILNSRININAKARKSGYEKLTIVNGAITSSQISAAEYNKWIESQLITNRKVVRGADGTGLHMKPVNAYFTFKVPDVPAPKTVPFDTKEKYDAFFATVEARYGIKVVRLKNDDFNKLVGNTTDPAKGRIRAQYEWHSNLITLNEDDYDSLVHAHEIIHAIVHNEMMKHEVSDKMSVKLREFYDKLLLEAEKQFAGKPETPQSKRVREILKYATQQSADELLTYGFTDPDFAKWLNKTASGVKVGKKSMSLWDEFVEIVKTIVGKIIPNSMLDELHSIVSANMGIENFVNPKVASKSDKYTEEDMQKALSLETFAEIEKEVARIKKLGIKLDDEQRPIFNERFLYLKNKEAEEKKAAEAAKKKRGGIIKNGTNDEDDNEEVPVMIKVKVDGKTYQINLAQDADNFMGDVPKDFDEMGAMVGAIKKSYPNTYKFKYKYVPGKNDEMNITHFFIATPNKAFAFDKDFKRIPDIEAQKMKEYNDIDPTNCK